MILSQIFQVFERFACYFTYKLALELSATSKYCPQYRNSRTDRFRNEIYKNITVLQSIF